MKCPSPVELERAFWLNAAEVKTHAEECARCGRDWDEIAALIAAGRELQPPPAAAERREEIRTVLLAKKPPPAAEPRRFWPVFAPLGAVAAAAAIWWLWPHATTLPTIAAPSPPPSAPAPIARGHVLEHGGARYMLAASQPDEIVRLVDGSLTAWVDKLQPGERFRVITGDGEVEVKGTAFDVTAKEDHLVAVRVMHGVVEVRVGAETRVLGAGESWQGEAEPATGNRQPATGNRPQAAVKRAETVRSVGQAAFDDGWHSIRAGSFREAAAAFESAAASGDPRVAEDALYWRAVALARAGDGGAVDAFERFLEAWPASPRAGEASVMEGWLLFERRDWARAANRFRAAAHDPATKVRSSAAEGLTAVEQARDK